MAGGRPTAFETEQKEEIFSHYLNYFRQNKKVPPKSDEIWMKIKEEFQLPRSVSAGAIYTAMLVRFQAVIDEENLTLNKPKEKNESTQRNKSKEKKQPSESKESDESDGSTEESDGAKCENKIRFKLKISKNVWDTIKPVDAVYSRVGDDCKGRRKVDRKYKVLPNGVWTYNLSRAIANQRKDVPCRWCFKRN